MVKHQSWETTHIYGDCKSNNCFEPSMQFEHLRQGQYLYTASPRWIRQLYTASCISSADWYRCSTRFSSARAITLARLLSNLDLRSSSSLSRTLGAGWSRLPATCILEHAHHPFMDCIYEPLISLGQLENVCCCTNRNAVEQLALGLEGEGSRHHLEERHA